MERSTNRFSLKDCRIACAYDPNCMVWQAFPIEHGRSCYQAYTGMNVTCTPPDPSSKKGPSFMDGGARSVSPDPAFHTDYSFATADALDDVDADWAVVDAPHDFISEYGSFTEDQSDQHHGYLPRNASFYRKHFHLPAAWESDGGATFVHFEGVFHHATIFLNGKYLMQHENGYLGFDVRLDNATGIRHGPDAENVLTLRADASFGSGHWYEGGGIYRPVHLEHVAPTHITRNGLFVPPEGGGTSIAASAELETTAATAQSATVRFSLFELGGGTAIATVASSATSVPAAGRGTVIASARLKAPAGAIKLWSTKHPQQYSVREQPPLLTSPHSGPGSIAVGGILSTFSDIYGTDVVYQNVPQIVVVDVPGGPHPIHLAARSAARHSPAHQYWIFLSDCTQVVAEVIVGGTTVDSVRTTVGFRETTFSGAGGPSPPFTLNDEPMHFRGFSHHNSIGGLGVAIPERVQLFRVQASRAMVRRCLYPVPCG